jgi:hypothetical protein
MWAEVQVRAGQEGSEEGTLPAPMPAHLNVHARLAVIELAILGEEGIDGVEAPEL